MNWAIVNGETVTGVTTMLIEKRLDAGDILLMRETPIGADETAPELAARLAPMGAALLIETLLRLDRGEITPRKQIEEHATYAPIMKREDGLIDWTLPASEIYNHIRGFDPWPGSYTTIRGKRLHIRRAKPADGPSFKPGRIDVADGLTVGCGGGTCLRIDQVQLEGKNRIAAEDFIRGYRPRADELLGAGGSDAS
jgi:methionyl-tRNA formyltransferase